MSVLCQCRHLPLSGHSTAVSSYQIHKLITKLNELGLYLSFNVLHTGGGERNIFLAEYFPLNRFDTMCLKVFRGMEQTRPWTRLLVSGKNG